MARPKNVPTSSELALEDASKQFDKFDEEIKTMTMDRMNLAPKQEVEPQTKLSQSEIAQTKDVYLKPKRTLEPGVNLKLVKGKSLMKNSGTNGTLLKNTYILLQKTMRSLGNQLTYGLNHFQVLTARTGKFLQTNLFGRQDM